MRAAPSRSSRPSAPREPREWGPAALWTAFGAAFVLAFWAYGPALDGAFVFDDTYLLPFLDPAAPASLGLLGWIAGLRPLLMLTFWANFQISGVEPWAYHATNVALHTVNAALVYLVVRRLLEWESGARPLGQMLALFAAGLFLLHPVQTESVAYVASRSEVLSILLFLGAYCVFLYRRPAAITWSASAAVLLLFVLALLTKEHAVVLPGLLLLTDYYWNPRFSLSGIRANWRLYLPVAVGTAAGLAQVYRVLSTATSAGFGMRDLTWYQYFFTQCRVFWNYLRLLVVPYPLNIDPDIPVSHTPLEHGALLGLLGLAALVAAAWMWRRRYPLASFGLLAALLLLAPTSSFAPLRDPMAEHRLYLPFFALTLVPIEFLRRLRSTRGTLAAALAGLLAVLGVVTWHRSQVWQAPVTLWRDSTARSPKKARPRFQLAYALYDAGRYQEAVREYDVASTLDKPDVRFLVDWALALDKLDRSAEALERLRQAVILEPSAHVYSTIGMVEARQNHAPEALAALAEAEKRDPNFDMTYAYRGNVLLTAGDAAGALREYRRALLLNPANQVAQQNLSEAIRRLAAPPPAASQAAPGGAAH